MDEKILLLYLYKQSEACCAKPRVNARCTKERSNTEITSIYPSDQTVRIHFVEFPCKYQC